MDKSCPFDDTSKTKKTALANTGKDERPDAGVRASSRHARSHASVFVGSIQTPDERAAAAIDRVVASTGNSQKAQREPVFTTESCDLE
jgi:hypothetical protein